MDVHMKPVFFLACLFACTLSVQGACDADWITQGSDCYKVIMPTAPDSYENTYEARQACLAVGADLASIPDTATEEALYTAILALDPIPEYVFIGLTDIADEGNFTWLDGSEPAYTNFKNATNDTDSEPNDDYRLGGEDCVAMRSVDKAWDRSDAVDTAWHDVPCRFNDFAEVPAVAACKKPDDGTPVTVVEADDILHQFVKGACLPGWKPDHAGHCYGLINGTAALPGGSSTVLNSSLAANEACALQGAHLAVVRNTDVMRLFSDIIRFMDPATRPEQFFIGHSDIMGAANVTDILGEGVTFTHTWDGDGAPASDATLRCVMAISTAKFDDMTAGDSNWTKVACCDVTPFEWVMCEKPESTDRVLADADNPFWHSCVNDTDDCVPEPCDVKGTCQDEIYGHVCICDPGWEGHNCSQMIDYCESNPCANDATCTPSENRYDCECVRHWNDTHCDNLIEPCYSNPCQNGATCDDSPVTRYDCNCVDGFAGVHCETNIDDCVNITSCGNGTCVDEINNAYCECNPGFTGDFCQTEMLCTPAVPVVHNVSGEVNGTGAFQDGYFTFRCLDGMKFDDMSTVKTTVCDNGEWTPNVDNMACSAHCDSIPFVANAIPQSNHTGVGNTVNYTCETGYRYPDNSTVRNITCMANGNWSTEPADLEPCEIVHCPELPVYPYQTLDTRNTTYATTVTFWCDVGYVLHDNTTARTIKCLADGDWTADLPECEPVECPKITQPQNSIRNTSANTYNTYAEYKCKDGMRMRDGATYRIIKCDATAEWSDNVTECNTDRCFPLPFVANATPHTTDAIFGTRVKLTCIEGHKYPISERDVEYMTCYENGRWNPILSSCEPLYCPDLELVKNAEVSENQTLFGTVVDYTCDTGHYVYDGPTPNHTVQSTQCLATKMWSNQDLQPCHPIQCEPPPLVENEFTGSVALPDAESNGKFNYSQQAVYNCLVFETFQYRFYDGQVENVLTCGADGVWDKSDVSCRKERCDPVEVIPQATPDSLNTSWDSIITFGCDKGYTWPPGRFGGKNKTTHHVECQRTGQWNETGLNKYYCDIKNCTVLPPMLNATLSTDAHHYDTNVTYACDVGFKFPDNDTEKSRWCSEAPAWIPGDDEWTSCEIIHCPELPDIENATRNSNDTEYDTEVTYSCLPGYQFPDKLKEKQVTCTENETWTEFPEACEVIFCMPIPQWGAATFNSSDNEFAATVRYECSDGYAFEDDLEPLDVSQKAKYVSEPRTAFCTVEKQWDPPLGNCIPTSSIAKGLAGNTTESEDAVSIGTICCSAMCVLMAGMVLLDLNKIWTDLKIGRENVRHMMKKKNKVSDSQAHIKDASESTA